MPAQPPRGQRIGLCMIVRDEAEVIGRCLASVEGLIDSWTICDTGSSDGTPELVEELLAHLPGTLHRREWRDFGQNRTELMEFARGTADYLLLLDADHTIERRGELPELSADAYLIEHAGELSYHVPRLVRGDLEWRFVGSTHEYLAGPEGASREILPELAVHHHADGGTRKSKFERDAQLLSAELEREPGNARATFYLAQTLRDLGRDAEAIQLYGRRVALGGWDEEVFYAAWQLGVLVARTDPDRGRRLLEEAHSRRPQRAEPLLDLARLARLRRDYQAALEIARRGVAIAEPGDLLFVHRDVYRWGLPFELAVAAYWAGHLEEAIAACDRLLATEGLPGDVAAATAVTRRYCVDALPPGAARRAAEGWGERLEVLCPDAEFAEINLDIEPAWPLFNPSIAADGDGFRMIVRSANYRLTEGRYRFLDDSETIRTLNYLVHLDGSLALTRIEPLADHGAGPPRFDGAPVQGYEDCRLFHHDGRWFASATVRDRNEAALCEIALLELAEARVARATVLAGPTPGRNEKNWMPYSEGGELRFVYSIAPTRLLACDPATGALTDAGERAAPLVADLRGGSQGLVVEDGRLFVVHEAFVLGAGRLYSQRVVLIDGEGTLAAVSPRFRFTAEPIEMCTGIARWGDRLVLSFGAGDRLAALAVVSEQALLGQLEDVTGGLTAAAPLSRVAST